jgi:serine/threonine protein kinase
MVLTTGVRLGRYEILAPLGSGDMGEVYRARDTRLGREVAVKVLPHDVSTSDAWRQRLEGEAKTISKLAHPHVCALFDVGREGDVDYLVMELLSGVTLAARLARGALPLEEVFRFGSEMASALAATHAVGIAHGDLKPSNVMVTKTGVKLLDFGVATRLVPPQVARDATWESTVSHGPTPGGGLIGTLPYMRPPLSRRIAPAPARELDSVPPAAASRQHGLLAPGRRLARRVARRLTTGVRRRQFQR